MMFVKNPKYAMGTDFLNAVADVLGLPLETEKNVIEAAAGELVRVFIVRQLPFNTGSALVQVVKELFVADDGTVSVTPHVVTGGPQP